MVSMRLWLDWHCFPSQWLVTPEGLCTAEVLTGKGSHVCRFGKTCWKPQGLSNTDRWQGAVPEKKVTVRVKSWRLVSAGTLHPPLLFQYHDSALIRGDVYSPCAKHKSTVGLFVSFTMPFWGMLYLFLHICPRTVQSPKAGSVFTL